MDKHFDIALYKATYNKPVPRELYNSLKNVLFDTRLWHKREQWASGRLMHPVMEHIIDHYAPVDWHALVLEWPHLSDDGKRLAYTRDDRAGNDDKQVVVATGKYVKRHFPLLADHQIRDFVAAFTPRTDVETFICRDIDEMVDFKQRGPKSCMTFRGRDNNHPYRVYDPSLGWGLAVRRATSDGYVFGTAIVLDDDELGFKGFVRSYWCEDNRDYDGYSNSDTELEAWLKSQGYTHHNAWPEGAQLLHLSDDRGVIMSYLDGHLRTLSEHTKKDGKRLFVFDERGDYEGECTSGYIIDRNRIECECCGDDYDEEDMHYVEDYGNVCESCIDYRFRWSSVGDEFVHESDAVETVSGGWIHGRRLGRYDHMMIDAGSQEGYAAPYDEVIVDAYGHAWHTDDEDEMVRLDDESYYGGESVHNEDPDLICTIDLEYFLERDIGNCVVAISAGPSDGEYVRMEDGVTIEDDKGNVWLSTEYHDHLENQRVNADAEQE